MPQRLTRLTLVLAFVLTLGVPALALAADPTTAPTPAPTLTGPATNTAPPPPAATRVLDAAGKFDAAQEADLATRVAAFWRDQNIDVFIALRVAPDRDTPAKAEQDAQNMGNAAGIGVDARGGLVVLFDLDDSKCHGQVQLYADDRLRVVLPNADRQDIYERLMKPHLADCDLYGATVAALDAAGTILRGDRPAVPAAADLVPLIVTIIVVVIVGLVLLFLLILLVGRLRAYPDARRRYRDMTDRYREGVEDPAVDTTNDDDFIYGGGHHRRNRRGRNRTRLGNPNWDDPSDYPIFYGRPPGFWGWWFGVGSHTANVPTGTGGGGSWAGGGGRSSGGSWGSSAGLAAGGFWGGLGDDAGSVLDGVGEVLDGLAEGSGGGSGGGGGFSGGGGAGGGF